VGYPRLAAFKTVTDPIGGGALVVSIDNAAGKRMVLFVEVIR